LNDLVVNFDIDELTYLEIVEYLNTQSEYLQFDDQTNTNTEVELHPNIKFSIDDDIV